MRHELSIVDLQLSTADSNEYTKQLHSSHTVFLKNPRTISLNASNILQIFEVDYQHGPPRSEGGFQTHL